VGRKFFRAALVSAVASGGALAVHVPAASADQVCQDLGGAATGCVTTTGDPSTGSFGVRVNGGPLNLCVVVFAACPEDPR